MSLRTILATSVGAAAAAIALSACGGDSVAAAGARSQFAGVTLTQRTDGTTLLEAGRARQVLGGRFEHARLAPEFAPDGLAPTGGRLVLEDVANHATRTASRFAVVDTALAGEPQIVALQGDFGYDAISADGATLYLTSWFSIERPTAYVVRSYDLRAGRMDSTIVADKSVLFEGPMAGEPVARATSETGAWVYTAYRGKHGFIHALDTVQKTSFCFDFPHRFAGVDDWKLRLDEGRNRLVATSASRKAWVRVNLRTGGVRAGSSA